MIFASLLTMCALAAEPAADDDDVEGRDDPAVEESAVEESAVEESAEPDPVRDDGADDAPGPPSPPAETPNEIETDGTEGSDADEQSDGTDDPTAAVETGAPTLLFAPPPNYPEGALAAGISGYVLLEIDANAKGTVDAVRVIEAERLDFSEAAVDNARSFVFSPMVGPDGTAIPFQLRYRTVFEATEAAVLSIEGTVREAGPRRSIGRAEILALGPSGERILATADAEGTFRFSGLSPGAWSVRISASGHVPEAMEVEVVDGKVGALNAYLVRDEVRTGTKADEVFIVTALAPETEVTERTLTAEDVRYLPGSGGDVVKVIQNLPGIARSPLGTGNLRIRGTAPEDSLYFIDGGQIPIVFHFSGLTTVLSSDLLEEVAYLPGSYSVQYGRALGGLVDLRTKRRLPERSNGNLSIDVFQAALFAEQRIGERDSLTLSTRRSYADAVLNPILNSGSLTVQAPRYYDAQIRWSRKLDNGWNDVMFLLSDDRFRFLGGDDDVVLAGFATQFQKLRWLQARDLGSDLTFESSVVVGPEKQFFETDNNSEAFEKEMRVATRMQWAQKTGADRRVGWLIGTDPYFNQSSFLYDIAAPPERTVTSDRSAPAESDEFNVWQPSLFGELTLKAGNATFFPGIRGDMQLVDETSVFSLDPRVRALWAVGDNTVMKGGAGRHSQAPTPRQLSVASDGNPDLSSESSYQFSAGIEQVITPWLTMDLTGFYHHLDDLIVGREDRFSFYSGPPPTGPFDTAPYANDGTGRTFGLEFLANIKADNTAGFLSATLSRSDRVKRPDAERTLFEYDQPLVINALVSQKLPKRWRLGARIRYGSGNPYTPVNNRIYNHERREFIPVYGERDSGRLPPFFSLDLRIDKDYVFKKWTLTTYLDIQNATYAKNVETQGYSYDYSEEEPILSSPPLPAFGLRGEW